MNNHIVLENVFSYHEEVPIWITIVVLSERNITVEIDETDLRVGEIDLPYKVKFDVCVTVAFGETKEIAETAVMKGMNDPEKRNCYHTVRLSEYLKGLRSALEMTVLVDKYLPDK